MRNDRGREPATDQARVLAECLWCGPVEFALHGLRFHVAEADQGLLEFSCPSCGRLNLRALGPTELASLAGVGATPGEGPAPFELLEEHAGPPITWDDLIDFHQSVSWLPAGTGSAEDNDGPEDHPARERDAA
jgi:hypothetical protein